MSKLFSDFEGDDGVPGTQRRAALFALMLGALIMGLDSSIVNVALPQIAIDMHAEPSAVVWVANAYTLAGAMSVVAFASMGDIIGYRKLYIGGLAVFTLASLGCSLAWSLQALNIFRFIQGLGCAAAMSIVPALYRQIFPARLLGSALGISSMMVAASLAAGPTIGGLLLAAFRWPSLFLVNLPIGIVTVMLSRKGLPRIAGRGGKFDYAGAVWSAIALGTIVVAVDSLSRDRQHSQLLWLSGIALAAVILFIRSQRRAKAPLLPLQIFSSPRFTLAICTSFCSFTAQGIAFIAMPFLFQGAFGQTPLMSAAMFTPWPLAIIVFGPLSGRLSDRLPPALLSTAGLLVYACGLVLLATLDAQPSVPDILWRTFVCGAGFGLFQSPNNREILSSCPREHSGASSGMLAIARTFGQSLGAAITAIAMFIAGAAIASAETANGDAGTESAGIHIALWIAAGAGVLAMLVSLSRVSKARPV
ncbi:MAG TPA: MFS transporter [Herbaspirillum sp.]|jgi:DHA2 family multidrug resistance protein-like MFS transporter